MRMLFLSLLAIVVPTSAFALTDTEKANVADALNKAYKSITVTVVSAPVIRGDKDPVIFRIAPAGKLNFGNLFLKGRYDISRIPPRRSAAISAPSPTNSCANDGARPRQASCAASA